MGREGRLWPFGENKEAGRASKRQADLETMSTLPAPNGTTEDFPSGFSFFYNHQSWHKSIVPRPPFTYVSAKSSKQPLVEVIVLISQIMELKLR